MIPDSLLEEVRARADIVEIVGEHLPLKRAGKDFKALCPFHHEKTPSFYVVPAKGIYKCFGCGESGDAFSFVMKRTGASFLEAVRMIAGKVGIDIPADTVDRGAEEPNRAVYAAIAFAADHFQRQLVEDAGEAARRYLEGRAISSETAVRFQIGCAPDEWRGLREAAQRHGIEDDVLLAAGLIKESERAEEPYDRFRDRIIFPVADVPGRLLAFGGRAMRLAENVPKYLNSPETVIYHKGQILYGLNWSRSAIRREGAALVVEGYMDYVSLASRGIEHVVAGMGTALTVEQANLVARYTAKAYLLYDSDTAGLRATFRSADALLRAGVHPLVVTLPPGEDPDSLVRRNGPDALRTRIEQSLDVIERKIQMLDDRGYFGDIDGSRRALDRLLPTLRSTIDPALRDIYVARVAERIGVRRETLEHEIENASSTTGAARYRPASPAAPPSRVRPEQPATSSRGAAERLLLLLMMRDNALVAQAAAALSAEEWMDPAHREIFEALVQRAGSGDARAELHLSAPAALRLHELERDPTEVADADQSFYDAVADIGEVPRLFRRLADLDERLARAANRDEESGILREKAAIGSELRARGVAAELGFKLSRRYRSAPRTRAAGMREPATDER
jgi:DNA primase